MHSGIAHVRPNRQFLGVMSHKISKSVGKFSILGGDGPPPKFSKTKKFLSKTSLYGLKYYKIVKKWSENASSKVQKSKIFLPRGRGRPFPWTPSPAASALRASARILGPSGLAYSGCSHLPSKISGSQPLFDFKKP